MRSVFVVMCLSAFVGCGRNEPEPKVVAQAEEVAADARTPDQMAAQAYLDEQAKEDEERAHQERIEAVIRKLNSLNSIRAYRRRTTELVRMQADGKITAKDFDRLKRELEDSVLAGEFSSE